MGSIETSVRSKIQRRNLIVQMGGGNLSTITLPLLKPVTFFVVAVGVIGTFQLFEQSYIFSGGTGGSNNATLTVVLLIYQAVFRNLQMGYAAAIAFLLAAVIIAITLI